MLGDVVLVKVDTTFIVLTESRTCHNLDLHRVQILSLNASQEVTDFGSIVDPGVSILGETVKDLVLLYLHSDKPFEVPAAAFALIRIVFDRTAA